MPRNQIFAILLLLATIAFSAASVAGERIALVIGNSNYEHVGRLPNPKNDANLMAVSLKKAGFTVTKLIDVNYRTLKRSIIAFGRKLRENPEAGLFYYAGHGVQVRGENYLIPVDANITDEDEVDLEAVNVNSFLRVMRASNSDLNIVVLDACRDNPFARSFRSSSRGLASVDAPRGTYIAYSTAPGNVAADGDGENSPYTLALAKSIDQRGAKIEDVFKNARKIVLKSTKNKQVPWETSSITGDFYFHKAVEKKLVVVKPIKPVVSSLPNNVQQAGRVYGQIKNTTSVSVLGIFADQYKGTIYARFALARIKELKTFGSINKKTAVPQKQKNEILEPKPIISAAEKEWNSIRFSELASYHEEFAKKHKGTRFAKLAKLRFEELREAAGKRDRAAFELEAEKRWNSIRFSELANYHEEFVIKYKGTHFAKLARNRITFLESKFKLKSSSNTVFEEEAEKRWLFLKSYYSSDKNALDVFARKYANTYYAKYARDQIQYLVNQDTTSEETWRKLQNSNDISGLRKLIKDFPNSTYAKYANDRIELIKHAGRIRQSSAAKGRLRQASIEKKRSRKIRKSGIIKIGKKIASSKRWNVYHKDHIRGTSCNTQTIPINRKAKAVGWIFISNWLFETGRKDGYHEPSAVILDKRLPVSKLTMEIDGNGKVYLFRFENSMAFLKSGQQYAEIVAEMKNGRRLVTKTTAKDGKIYKDTFSLSGFTKTLAKVDQRCPAIIE